MKFNFLHQYIQNFFKVLSDGNIAFWKMIIPCLTILTNRSNVTFIDIVICIALEWCIICTSYLCILGILCTRAEHFLWLHGHVQSIQDRKNFPKSPILPWWTFYSFAEIYIKISVKWTLVTSLMEPDILLRYITRLLNIGGKIFENTVLENRFN